jgi:hypothetical protein
MLKLLQVVSTKQPSSRRHSRSNPTLWTIREKVTALAGAQPLVSLLKHAYSFGALPEHVVNSPCPCAKRSPSVAGMWRSAALMESDVTPVRGSPAGVRSPGESARHSAAPCCSRSRLVSGVNHHEWRNWTATLTPWPKHVRVSSSASRSSCSVGGSCNKTGPSLRPSPYA